MMSIEKYLKNHGFTLDEKEKYFVDIYKKIISGVDVSRNVDILLTCDFNLLFHIICQDTALYSLSVELLEKIYSVIKENDPNKLLQNIISSKIEDYITYELLFDGINEKNLKIAENSFEFGKNHNFCVSEIAWKLAYFYEYIDFNIAMRYIDYAINNSYKEHYVLSGYGEHCVYFAHNRLINNDIKSCDKILATAFENIDLIEEKYFEHYYEYFKILTYSVKYHKILDNKYMLFPVIESAIRIGLGAIVSDPMEEILEDDLTNYFDFLESNLLELYISRLDYCLKIKDYKKFIELYNLTMEDVINYNYDSFEEPIREIYWAMISNISIEYEELRFLRNLTSEIKLYFKEKIESYKELDQIRIFTLVRKDNDSEMEFYLEENWGTGNDEGSFIIVAVPNLSLLREGASFIYKIYFEDEPYILLDTPSNIK